MSRRSRPQYRSGLGWILGVAFEDTLTRPVRLAQGFTCVRCCGTPRASSPHDLTAPALASHDGRDCVQLPLARGCYHLAPRWTFTSNPVPMPGTPPVGLRPPLVPTPMRQRPQTRQDATYRSRKSVQTTGAGSDVAATGNINHAGMVEHRERYKANHALVVAPGFSDGALAIRCKQQKIA